MYTNIFVRGNTMFVRGVENGSSYSTKVDFAPTLWISAKKTANQTTDWKTLEGKPVYPIQPGSMRECREFMEQYAEVEGFPVYEPPGFIYQYISQEHPDEIKWDPQDITIFTIDIETETEYGFPDPALANEEILLITVKDKTHKKIVTFARKKFENKRKDVTSYVFDHEDTMLREFVQWWSRNYPDVMTGWNSSLFDATYLYNRCVSILGETFSKRLSPFGFVLQRDVDLGGRKAIKTSFAGISHLDYLDLYKKFTYSAQESYKLDYIASVELGERKKENPGTSFKDFYTNYWQQFVEYNIHDVELVDKLDDKMRLLELAFTMAYDAKILFEDVYSPVKMWDVIIYNHLLKENTVIPLKKNGSKTQAFEGAYVKDPLIGKHNWCVSFDLNSLYPHLIMQYNMSPETITSKRLNVSVDELLAKEIDTSELIDEDLAMAANGVCFRRDKKGLLPTLMQYYYDRRVQIKRDMLKAKQQLEDTKDPKWEKEISRLNNMQMAVKIAINSAYGACGNAYFRYFDVRIAEGVTVSGQLSIRWIANKLNQYFNKVVGVEKDRVVLIDTDSVVLTLEDLIAKFSANTSPEQTIKLLDNLAEDKIQPYIDKSYQELADYMNAYEQKMQMKRENLVDTMISVSKKRYVMSVYNSEGVQYKEPKLKIMGLQMVKSSTPAVIRDKLREALPTIIRGTQDDVQKFVNDYRAEFNKLTVEEIAFPRSISDVKKYNSDTSVYIKGTPIHVRGALLYNYHLKRLKLDKKYPLIREGDKIKFVYLKTPNPFQEDCIAFPDTLPVEFNLTNYVDYGTMYEKTFEDAVQNILDALGWSTRPKASLEDFFA